MIGAALVTECLKRGVCVTALIRGESPHLDRLPVGREGFCHLPCALEELSGAAGRLAGREYDTFFHIAWAHTGAKRNASTLLQSENIGYTLAAVRLAASLGCKRFVGAGSQAEFGPQRRLPISPDDPAKPDTPYGAAKLSACLLSKLLCQELGLEWVWPRIFSVYGIYEKDSEMIPCALRAMSRGEEMAFSDGEQTWDYLYSEDAGRAMFLLGEAGRDGLVYCLGSGQGRPLKDYIREMSRITGGSDAGIGKKPGDGLSLLADCSSLKADTGFVPEVSFEEGIRKTLAFLKEHGEE